MYTFFVGRFYSSKLVQIFDTNYNVDKDRLKG